MGECPKINNYLSIPGSSITLSSSNDTGVNVVTVTNKEINFENTLLDYYYKNYYTKPEENIEDSFMLRLFLDYELRPNLKHFIQYLLSPTEEFYYYFISIFYDLWIFLIFYFF